MTYEENVRNAAEEMAKRRLGEVDQFNAKYPVGATMGLLDDFGDLYVVQAYAPASIISGQAVGWVTSDSIPNGSYLLKRLIPIRK